MLKPMYHDCCLSPASTVFCTMQEAPTKILFVISAGASWCCSRNLKGNRMNKMFKYMSVTIIGTIIASGAHSASMVDRL